MMHQILTSHDVTGFVEGSSSKMADDLKQIGLFHCVTEKNIPYLSPAHLNQQTLPQQFAPKIAEEYETWKKANDDGRGWTCVLKKNLRFQPFLGGGLIFFNFHPNLTNI